MAGYRAYASNTIERQWRTIKGLLGNYATFDSSQLIVRVCEIFRALATQANLRDLRLRIDDPLDRLFNDPSPPSSERLSNGSQPRLLTVARILDYLRQHSPGDVYIHEEVDWRVVVNHVEKRASDILVIPKYQLRFGTEQRQLMEQVLQILAAQERATWLLAFSGDYSLDHHRKLFERFTAVYRFTDGTFFDIHKDFLSQQQTSHYHFFRGFWDTEELQRPAEGPKSSRPARVAKRARRNEDFKALLGKPLSHAMSLPIAVPPLAPHGSADARPDSCHEDGNEDSGVDSDAVVQIPVSSGHSSKVELGSGQRGNVSGGPMGLRRSLTAFAQRRVAEGAGSEGGSSIDNGLCRARVWSGGLGGQCTRKPKVDEFCAQHARPESRKHGRVDEAIPAAVQREFDAHQKKKGGFIGQARGRDAGQTAAPTVAPVGSVEAGRGVARQSRSRFSMAQVVMPEAKMTAGKVFLK